MVCAGQPTWLRRGWGATGLRSIGFSGDNEAVKRMWQKIWAVLGPKGLALVGAMLLVMIVGFQNMEPADIDLLFWDLMEVPKLYMIVGFTVFGFVVGLLTGWIGLRRRRRIRAEYEA